MRLIGSMLTTRIFLAAMSRANLPAPQLAKLPHFYFYVDEFQNFANETFAEILSEARKYKLNLVIAHQYIEQMEEEVRDAVFGNVGTTVVFRVGPFDAEVLETIFMPKFTKEDVVSLDRRQVYLSLMIDGVGSQPFSAVTIPPIEAPSVSYREQVVASSRVQFTAERAGIEKSIVDELMASASSEAPFDARMKKKPKPVGAMSAGASQRSSDLPVQAFHPSLKTMEGTAPVGARPFVHRPPTSRPPQEQVRKEFVSPPHPRPEEPHRDFVPRPPMERPAPSSKSTEDLKAILRKMTEKSGAEREQKQSKNQQSLKGTLAEVLEKSEQKVAGSMQEMPKPVEVKPPQKMEEKKPFEVPEDALRKVLKGES